MDDITKKGVHTHTFFLQSSNTMRLSGFAVKHCEDKTTQGVMRVLRGKQRFPFFAFCWVGKFGGYLPLHIGEALSCGLLLGGVATIVLIITLGKATLTVTY